MKLEWKSCFRIGVSTFLLFLCIYYWKAAIQFLGMLVGAASPLIIGFIIAYLINILMSFYEKYYFPKSKQPLICKSRRIVCMLAAMVTLLGIVVFVFNLVLPELVSCVQLLVSEVPYAIEKLVDAFISNESLASLVPENIIEELNSINWKDSFNQIVQFISSGIGEMAGAVTSVVTSVFSGLISSLIGIIFSIYILLGKDQLKGQFHRFMKNYLPSSWRNKVEYVLFVINDCFHRYIVGQCIEAVILGTLCSVGMAIFQFPYAIMIGALVSVTALIPVAGAYIGAGVGVFMMLTVSPIKAVLFLVFIVVLQQLEGNLIYPKVVGSSLGLPGIWVLAAVTVGGSVMGVVGMLLGVPVTAAVYRLIHEDMERREQAIALECEKQIALEAKKQEETKVAQEAIENKME